MENKKAAILVLAIVAAVIVTASGAYAMGRQATSQAAPYTGAYPYGMGPGMMGGFGGPAGYRGGMMGGYGMMGYWNGTGATQQCPRDYMWQYWNSTSAP